MNDYFYKLEVSLNDFELESVTLGTKACRLSLQLKHGIRLLALGAVTQQHGGNGADMLEYFSFHL